MDIITAVTRTILFYGVINLIYRLMGKREIGELSIIDFTLSMLVAQLASICIENLDTPVTLSLFPILTLLLLELIFSFISLRKAKIRRFIDGEPAVIINKGRINYSEMLRQRYNIDDLIFHLRSNGIVKLEDIYYAILENDGSLSIFKRNECDTYPFPIIVDGIIDDNALMYTNIDLNSFLKDNKKSINKIFYANVYEDKMYIIEYKDNNHVNKGKIYDIKKYVNKSKPKKKNLMIS